MPLTGHAFVGAATALLITPEIRISRQYSLQTLSSWIPFNITLAYLPDITTELFFLAGCSGAKITSHSFLFAGAAALLCTFVFTHLFSIPVLWRFFFFFAAISLHDILDMLQSTDRQPFWPFSDITVACPLIPDSPLSEGLLFFLLFIVFLTIFYCLRKPIISLEVMNQGDGKTIPRPRTIFIILACILVATAIITHQARILREKQLNLARHYIFHQQFDKGFALLQKARQWPAHIHPGRVEYLQGYILAQKGKTGEAEKEYLRSWKKDPHYFWTVADLIILYAQQDISLADKQRLIKPWYNHLLNDFPNQPDLPEYQDRIRQLLGKEFSAIKDN